MSAYSVDASTEFFIMYGGAAAALAGLVFVAVSLNLDAVLKRDGLPQLAMRTLAMLIALVVVAGIGLTPGQAPLAVGIEILLAGSALATLLVVSALRTITDAHGFRWRISLIGLPVIAWLPLVWCGVSVALGVGGGLYWASVGFIGATIVAAFNAWVLLVEIRR